MIITEEEAKRVHQKVREILQDYGNPEWGDCIIDEISFAFNYPTTTDVEDEEI